MFAAVRTPTARLAATALRPSAFRVAIPQARHYHEKVSRNFLISSQSREIASNADNSVASL